MASLIWPAAHDGAARAALAAFAQPGDAVRANGLLVKSKDLFDAAAALARAGVGPVSVTHPTYVFEAVSTAANGLAEAIARGG